MPRRTARRLAAQAAGIDARLIATLMRSHEPEANLAFVHDIEANGIPDGLVAVDLAGPEQRFPDPTIHHEAIDLAREIGLHVTAHAGEWGGAAQVRRTLAIDPDRIAHGPLAIDDPASSPSSSAAGPGSTCAPPRTSRRRSCPPSRTTRCCA